MKQIRCEMCGSSNIIKQDGAFVCESCGCKYSVEEAKKMMIEGSVDVQGTVKIDNSDNVEKHIANARRAMQKRDWEEVEKYYNLVEQNDPTNIEAIFYSSYGKARMLLIETEYFKRAHAFDVLCRSTSIIDDNYTPGNTDMLAKISNDIDEITSSSFVYRLAEKDKIDETYNLFFELRSSWTNSLINMFNKAIDDNEKKTIAHLAIEQCKKVKLTSASNSTNLFKLCTNIDLWLLKNDSEYAEEHKRNDELAKQQKIENRKGQISKEIKNRKIKISGRENNKKSLIAAAITSLCGAIVFFVLAIIFFSTTPFLGWWFLICGLGILFGACYAFKSLFKLNNGDADEQDLREIKKLEKELKELESENTSIF